jgi:hypothetical protein
MSFTSIPNQPILFHTQDEIQSLCDECGSSDYKQLVDFNDQIFYQIESTPCPSSRLFPYDTFTYGWGDNISPGKVCSDDIEEAGIYSKDLRTNYIYQLYQVTFTILNFDEGTLNVSMDGSSTYQISLPGTYTFYFANPTMTNDSVTLRFFTNSGEVGWLGCLVTSSIQVDGIATSNQMKLGIVDATTLETIDLITPLYTLKDNKITAAFDLTNVEIGAGCYRLAITDFCTNTCGQSYVYNGIFRDANGVAGWTTSGNASVILSEGQVDFNLEFNEFGSITSNQGNPLCEGLFYYVSLFIEARSGVKIFVTIGDVSVEVIGSGYQTIGITAGTGDTHVKIDVYQFLSEPSFAVIKLVEVGIDDSNIQWDLFTDILDIGDYNDSCKYFKIEGCNAEDQFNLAFGGSSFLPMIRLEGRRAKAQYVTNANTFRYASGKWSANYVNRLKQWTYFFGRLPEYVLDFISTIFYYDNCYVNGVLMFPQDNSFPTIDWSDADTYLGSFAIDLLEKDNKVVKVQCGDSDADCLPSILDNSEEPFLLTQDLNRITTQDSINLYYENNL